MSKKPTLYVVTDIETTIKKRMAFDIAWQTIDKTGKIYAKGSFVIREAFKVDVPFFKEKLGHYFDDAWNHLIQPASIFEVREEYNDQITNFKNAGHRVVGCAYNAAFDFKYMPETIQTISDNPAERWMNQPFEMMDIWDYWGNSVPLHYQAETSASGKYYSTSAESAYRWEFCEKNFVERHMAWHDCEIESAILLKALARKQVKPIVNHPKKFAGAVWKKINTRLGVTGKEMLAA